MKRARDVDVSSQQPTGGPTIRTNDTLLLLLSRDLRFAGRDLRLDGPDLVGEPADEQLALPGFTAPSPRRARRRPRPGEGKRAAPPADDPLLTTYLRRLAAQGVARKGWKAYRYQVMSTLLTAARLGGRTVTCADLFQDETLLGLVLVDDTAPTLGTRMSKWSLAQRRSAFRSFVTLMRPELTALVGEEPHSCLDRALRTVAERVGAGYRLTGGAPRRRGGRAPSGTQIQDVLDVIGRAPGYLGTRNRAFFTILAETGARVSALRELDGADCIGMPNGRLRIFLHEKGKGELREVELSRETADALRAYAEAFNCLAAVRRWPVRVRLGEPGPIWRNSPRGCWSSENVRETLRAGCRAAEVPVITPHALRRAFATDAASVLPRHTVAQAGGWKGLERLDDHYVQPRGDAIRAKLNRQEGRSAGAMTSEEDQREATRTL
jgi:integrase